MSHKEKRHNRGDDGQRPVVIVPPNQIHSIRCSNGCRITMHKCAYKDTHLYVGQCRHVIYHTSIGRHVSHDQVRAFVGMLPA